MYKCKEPKCGMWLIPNTRLDRTGTWTWKTLCVRREELMPKGSEERPSKKKLTRWKDKLLFQIYSWEGNNRKRSWKHRGERSLLIRHRKKHSKERGSILTSSRGADSCRIKQQLVVPVESNGSRWVERFRRVRRVDESWVRERMSEWNEAFWVSYMSLNCSAKRELDAFQKHLKEGNRRSICFAHL